MQGIEIYFESVSAWKIKFIPVSLKFLLVKDWFHFYAGKSTKSYNLAPWAKKKMKNARMCLSFNFEHSFDFWNLGLPNPGTYFDRESATPNPGMWKMESVGGLLYVCTTVNTWGFQFLGWGHEFFQIHSKGLYKHLIRENFSRILHKI